MSLRLFFHGVVTVNIKTNTLCMVELSLCYSPQQGWLVYQSTYNPYQSSYRSDQHPLPPQRQLLCLYSHTHTHTQPYWKETVSHTEHEPSVFPILVPCECSCFKIMRHHLQLFLPCWLEENLGLVYTLPPTLWISMHPHRSLSGCLACSSRLITVLILNESLITRPAQN